MAVLRRATPSGEAAAADGLAHVMALARVATASADRRRPLRLHGQPADERGAEDEDGGGECGSASGVTRSTDAKIQGVSVVSVVLLALAVAVLLGAEWPRLEKRLGTDARRGRARARQKANLRLVKTESDEFAEAVRRDLDKLPTIERDPRS